MCTHKIQINKQKEIFSLSLNNVVVNIAAAPFH